MLNNGKLQRLTVSDNKRFLSKEDGSPFFWLGDTAWELFHKLSREEADLYLENRAENGFNVIQAVALAELEGLTTENAYGRKPLLLNQKGEYDPTLPDTRKEGKEDYSYWDHVDYIIDKAESLGLYIGLLPTWGDKYNKRWGKGPVVFTEENARIYGKWIGERYKGRNNIIWIMGGDRSLDTAAHFGIIRGMAEEIREGDGGIHRMTFHPMGGNSSSFHVHDERWLDCNMIQSGHGRLNLDNYKMIQADYDRLPVKPTLDGEPRYEDHPIGFKPENGYFDDFDVRQAAYWAVFAGGLGHTYGHHSIWSMYRGEKDTSTARWSSEYMIMQWKDALNRPGASQMKHLKNLMESRPFFERVPNQSLIEHNYTGANYMISTCGESYAFIYNPTGLGMRIKLGIISGQNVKASWYDPRKGQGLLIGEFKNTGVVEFTPPRSGRGNDWVLVLDDAAKDYPAPGC